MDDQQEAFLALVLLIVLQLLKHSVYFAIYGLLESLIFYFLFLMEDHYKQNNNL